MTNAGLYRATPAAGTNWFSGLPAHVRQEMERCMTRQSTGAGQTIFLAGECADSMYRIASGRVRVRSLSPGGKEVLLLIYGAGHFIGTVAVLDGLPRHNDAVAECATELDMLRSDDFHRIAQAYPEVYRAIAVSYALWMRDHQSMFAGGESLEERLARRLNLLLDFGAAQEADGGILRLDFTQEMLASSVAVTRQAISKLLQKWQVDGVIDYKHGSVIVRDRTRLRQLATRH